MEKGKVTGVKKIAVLRVNALGDFIFVIPALQALRETYPEAEIIYMGKQWHKEFLETRPSPVDRVEIVPSYPGVGGKEGEVPDKKDVKKFWQRFRAEKLDIAIQLHGGGRNSNPFLLELGARVNVGMRTPEAVELDRWIPYIYYQNESLRYLETVALVGAKTTKLNPTVAVTDEDRAAAVAVFSREDRPLVVIHPGATDLRRRWSPWKFGRINDWLAENGVVTAIVGVESEAEITAEVIKMCRYKPIDLTNKLTLSALAGLLESCDLVVANDSGPIHLAEAVGTKTVGIYWCGNVINAAPLTRTKFRPLASWVVNCPICGVDIASPGEPFYKEKTPCKHLVSFVEGVTVDEVKKNIVELAPEIFQ